MAAPTSKSREGRPLPGDEYVNDHLVQESEKPDQELMEALEDMKQGRYLEFDNIEDLIAELKS